MLGAVQVGLRLPQPDRRLRRRPLQPAAHASAAACSSGRRSRGATGHVTTYDELLCDARADGHQRGVLHPGGAGADRRLSTPARRARAPSACTRWRSTAASSSAASAATSPTHPDLGWRLAFDACGVVGMLYAVPLLLLLRDAPRIAGDADAAARAVARPRAVRELLDERLVHPAGALLHAAGAGRLGRARLDAGDPQGRSSTSARARPASRPRSTGRSPRSSARSPAAGWPTAGCGAPPRGRIFVSAIGMALIVPAMFGVGNAPARLLRVAVAFLILFGLGWGFFDCNNMPILCQIVRPELRATGYGIMNLVSISCGGFADWGFGAAARPARAAQRHLRRLRQRRACSRSCSCCSSDPSRITSSRSTTAHERTTTPRPRRRHAHAVPRRRLARTSAVVETQAAHPRRATASATVFIGGITGESHSLTLEERLALSTPGAKSARRTALRGHRSRRRATASPTRARWRAARADARAAARSARWRRATSSRGRWTI